MQESKSLHYDPDLELELELEEGGVDLNDIVPRGFKAPPGPSKNWTTMYICPVAMHCKHLLTPGSRWVEDLFPSNDDEHPDASAWLIELRNGNVMCASGLPDWVIKMEERLWKTWLGRKIRKQFPTGPSIWEDEPSQPL